MILVDLLTVDFYQYGNFKVDIVFNGSQWIAVARYYKGKGQPLEYRAKQKGDTVDRLPTPKHLAEFVERLKKDNSIMPELNGHLLLIEKNVNEALKSSLNKK